MQSLLQKDLDPPFCIRVWEIWAPQPLIATWIIYVTYSASQYPICLLIMRILGFPCGSDSKESACNSGHPCWIPGLERPPGEGNGSTLVFLLGEFHGQSSLADYSLWDHKESDATEQLLLFLNFSFDIIRNRHTLKRSLPSKWFCGWKDQTSHCTKRYWEGKPDEVWIQPRNIKVFKKCMR